MVCCNFISKFDLDLFIIELLLLFLLLFIIFAPIIGVGLIDCGSLRDTDCSRDLLLLLLLFIPVKAQSSLSLMELLLFISFKEASWNVAPPPNNGTVLVFVVVTT